MNKLKNEVTVTLAGKEIILRPTFQCLVAIETKAGKSLVQMTEEIAQQRGTLTDALLVIEEGSKAAGNPVTKDELIAIVEDIGIVPMQMALATFFGTALYGGDMSLTDSKKKKMTRKA